jgi:hypothetical protein
MWNLKFSQRYLIGFRICGEWRSATELVVLSGSLDRTVFILECRIVFKSWTLKQSRFFDTPETNNPRHTVTPRMIWTDTLLKFSHRKSQCILKLQTVKSPITKYKKIRPSSRMWVVEEHLQGLSYTALVFPKILSRYMRQTPPIAEQKNAL